MAIVCHIPTPAIELCLFPFKKHFKHLLHSVKKTESIENTGIKDVLDRFGNLAIKCYLISSKYFPITHDHNLANTT